MSEFGGSRAGRPKERRGLVDKMTGRRPQEKVKVNTVSQKGTVGQKRLRRWIRATVKANLRKKKIAKRQKLGKKRGMSPAAMAETYRRKGPFA